MFSPTFQPACPYQMIATNREGESQHSGTHSKENTLCPLLHMEAHGCSRKNELPFIWGEIISCFSKFLKETHLMLWIHGPGIQIEQNHAF